MSSIWAIYNGIRCQEHATLVNVFADVHVRQWEKKPFLELEILAIVTPCRPGYT